MDTHWREYRRCWSTTSLLPGHTPVLFLTRSPSRRSGGLAWDERWLGDASRSSGTSTYPLTLSDQKARLKSSRRRPAESVMGTQLVVLISLLARHFLQYASMTHLLSLSSFLPLPGTQAGPYRLVPGEVGCSSTHHMQRGRAELGPSGGLRTRPTALSFSCQLELQVLVNPGVYQ